MIICLQSMPYAHELVDVNNVNINISFPKLNLLELASILSYPNLSN